MAQQTPAVRILRTHALRARLRRYSVYGKTEAGDHDAAEVVLQAVPAGEELTMHPVIWLALGVLLVTVGLAAVFWRDIPEGEWEECVDENGTCSD